MYRKLEVGRPVEDFRPWGDVCGPYKVVAGHTYFGDFVLMNPDNGQFALLLPMRAKIFPMNCFTNEDFENFLSQDDVVDEFLRSDDVASLVDRLGALEEDEIFIPVPYPFLGGRCELDSYEKGNVWTFAKVVGAMQGVGGEDDASVSVVGE